MSSVAHECSLHGGYIHFTQLHVLITIHSCKALALKYNTLHFSSILRTADTGHWNCSVDGAVFLEKLTVSEQVKKIPPPFVELKNLPSSQKPFHGPSCDPFQSTQDIRFALQCGWVLWSTGMIFSINV